MLLLNVLVKCKRLFFIPISFFLIYFSLSRKKNDGNVTGDVISALCFDREIPDPRPYERGYLFE